MKEITVWKILAVFFALLFAVLLFYVSDLPPEFKSSTTMPDSQRRQ